MKTYEILPHTADMRVELKADSLEELITAGIEGMSEILKKGACRDKGKLDVAKTVAVSSIDTTSLFIDFMSEVLSVSHEKHAVFCEVQVSKLDKIDIIAEILGRRVDSFDRDIKAVTYHEAEVRINKEGIWETVVIFDV